MSNELKQRAIKVAKSPWSIASFILTFIAIVYVVIVVVRVSNYIDRISVALTPPELPELVAWSDTENLNPSGWPQENSDWFRFANQGTATFPIPYDWFMALEEPKAHPRWALFGGAEPLIVDQQIYQYGFIKSEPSDYNPAGLPIGFSVTPSIYFQGLGRRANALGLTCAACHTGQIIHNDKRYIIDGGSAVIDMGLLGKSLGAALGQTELSGSFMFLNGRFRRFAARVLGKQDNVINRNRLKKELSLTLKKLQLDVDVIKTTEGFTRNDALNRIGNQVFAHDMSRPANKVAITAPVNYPHIWTTSWFDWVQYDGSIMQPLVRNSGEALGVKAYLDTKSAEGRFASSVNMGNLFNIENWLAGNNPKLNNNRFNGLKAPRWPSEFGEVDTQLAAQGKELYQELCVACHYPATNTQDFWSDEYWQPISYYAKDGSYRQTEQAYLKLEIVSQQDIGTDPNQGNVLVARNVDSTGLQIDQSVCVKVPDKEQDETYLKYLKIDDSPNANFGLSLGAVVARTNKQWFKENFVGPDRQHEMQGLRPNCLQTGQGYKARPLNGVWATAPYLHNGSVASLYDLLSPASERPRFVELGSPEYNFEKMGVVQGAEVAELNKKAKTDKQLVADLYSDKGYFILDTEQSGNSNLGHSFEGGHREVARDGIVRRLLSEQEKLALIEYLKQI